MKPIELPKQESIVKSSKQRKMSKSFFNQSMKSKYGGEDDDTQDLISVLKNINKSVKHQHESVN